MTKMFVLLFVAISCLEAAKLPSYIVPCRAKDPKFNECLRQHGQDALLYLIKGDSKYKIPNMAPLTLPETQFTSGNLNVHLRNIVITGLENVQLKDIKMDLLKKKVFITVTADTLNLVSDYVMKGSILILPITGKGKANITFVGGEYEIDMDYTLKDQKGRQYIKLLNDNISFKTKRSYYHFDNLFGGDKALGENMNKFLNEQWQDVEHEIAPGLIKIVSTLVQTVVEGLTGKVQFDEIILP